MGCVTWRGSGGWEREGGVGKTSVWAVAVAVAVAVSKVSSSE